MNADAHMPRTRLTYQLQAISFWMRSHIHSHVSIVHPPRNDAEFEPLRYHTFNRQNVGMVHALAGYHPFVVLLDERSTSKQVWGTVVPYPCYAFDVVGGVDTE